MERGGEYGGHGGYIGRGRGRGRGRGTSGSGSRGGGERWDHGSHGRGNGGRGGGGGESRGRSSDPAGPHYSYQPHQQQYQQPPQRQPSPQQQAYQQPPQQQPYQRPPQQQRYQQTTQQQQTQSYGQQQQYEQPPQQQPYQQPPPQRPYQRPPQQQQTQSWGQQQQHQQPPEVQQTQPNQGWVQPGRPSPWKINPPNNAWGLKAPSPAPSALNITSALVTDVVPAIASLEISKQTLPSSSLDNAGKHVPVKRPDNGGTKATRTVRLRANHFSLSFQPESTILHYDVDVKPENPTKNGRPVKILKSELFVIRKKLCSDRPLDFPLLSSAYDGEKNIFSAVPLPSGSIKVEIPEEEDTRFRSYVVTLKFVNKLKFCKLREYLSGQLLSIPRDILQGMDLVMKENPSSRLIAVGRHFYPAEFNHGDDLGRGIAASRGFQHSVRLTSQGPALCLDYSVLAFHKRLPVIDFLKQHIWGFSLNNFNRFRREVVNALKGLKVTVTHRKTKQKYIIKGLTDRNAGDITFEAIDPDGQCPARKVRLADYFREKYKAIQYQNIPCLDLGKNGRKNDTPLEFCVLVEGQRYSKESLDNNAAIMLKNMSLPSPDYRKKLIGEMVQSASGPCGGGIVKNFGIEVNKNMTPVTGRVIGPPELKLGASGGKMTKVTVDREKCQWNMVGKSLVEAKPINCWALLDFSSNDQHLRPDPKVLNPNSFIPKLIARCNKLGIRMGEPVLYESTTMRPFLETEMLRQLLQSVVEKARKQSKGPLQLLVCVMYAKDPGYKNLKLICETQIGIVTQCCLSKMANIANDQYLANLGLKINAKLGGSNVELVERLPLVGGGAHAMFVGADVNHPAARNTTSPSIAAVVATVNWPAANRYAARIRPQYHRTEKILNFGDMCLELVESYERMNKVKPAKIVVFRDGVSEGQFDMALNEELLDLKRALGSKNYYPTITLIVAQKRHHTRLFPESVQDGSSTGNAAPGTVVDTAIVHPFEFDFYLYSHYGAIGTSKATHYHVLWDEHRFTSDQLQKLIYDLCFTFARCTKPVSLVPPVYYADLVAYRGRLYHESMEQQSPASSISSASASSSSVTSLGERFFKLHPELENLMYFV